MSLFYEREETEKQVIICFKKAAWFYVTVWPLLVVMCISTLLCRYNPFFGLVVLVIALWCLTWAISFYRPVAEIKRAQKKDRVQSSGSKYSLSAPMTYIIDKQKADNSSGMEEFKSADSTI